MRLEVVYMRNFEQRWFNRSGEHVCILWSASEYKTSHNPSSSFRCFLLVWIKFVNSHTVYSATLGNIILAAVMHVVTQSKGKPIKLIGMLCSPLIDCWQQMNPLLSLGANQTHRFTYSTDCVLQQSLLLLAPCLLQAAPQYEGQDFCLCRKKRVFTHKNHTFALTSHELNTSFCLIFIFILVSLGVLTALQTPLKAPSKLLLALL